jgi:acyl dehydratase
VSETSKTTLERVEDLQGVVGARLGVGPWQTIDQAAIDGFAEVTGDRQWIHVDPERAAGGPFGTTIAHGFLTLSLCAPIIEQTLEVRGAGMQVNYGLEKVRFPAPVPVGSRMRGTVELAALEEVGGGVQATLRITIEIAGQAKPACVADALVRFYA